MQYCLGELGFAEEVKFELSLQGCLNVSWGEKGHLGRGSKHGHRHGDLKIAQALQEIVSHLVTCA